MTPPAKSKFLSDAPSAADQSREECSVFPNTSWSLIRQSQEVANPQALQALDQLARSYWRPLYAFVRSLGYDQHWAEDAVQRFFEQLVSRDSLRAIIPGETRFRSFLIACLKHSLASEHRAQLRQKRGGGVALESLTEEHAEGLEGTGGRSAEEAMDREWAQEVFERAFTQLEADAAQRGRAGIFVVLRPILRGEAPAGGMRQWPRPCPPRKLRPGRWSLICGRAWE